MTTKMAKLSNLRIVLVEPAGALNVGSVARVMKNMGLGQLILVQPHCDRNSDEARQMAVHGIDILEGAIEVNSLPEALKGCHRAIATTSRSRTLATPLESPRIAFPWLLEENLTSALIFGPEDRGLSNVELNYAQRFVGIPANPEYPSLNLAQAVAVCAYELYQIALEQEGESARSIPSSRTDVATLDALEGYYQHLESVLLRMGYLYPHTAAARMEKFRSLYNRANLSHEELALLRGILGHLDWILQLVPARREREIGGRGDKGELGEWETTNN
ncbi:RNA methyltransferase, TrmH family, group 1 [Pleurocapsa sp. PCC 7327]|nr:RNA methyltransferase, TrmH family, group 1 [Pleurocapsa sp. PCC 7327]